MIEPIRLSSLYHSTYAPDLHNDGLVKAKLAYKKEDLHAADSEVASLYYQSSIQSLKASMDAPVSNLKNSSAVAQETKKDKSMVQKFKDWFWNLLGYKSETADAAPVIGEEESTTQPIDGAPKLPLPDNHNKQRISQAVAEFNRELTQRMKEIAEFEEEMLKASSNQLDRLIFKELISSSLNQKKLKEETSSIDQEELFRLHKKNKELQVKYYSVVDEILERSKTTEVLHWVNIGATGVVLLSTAAVIFTAGSFTPFLALASIFKGGTTLSEGILKQKNEKSKGELFIVTQDTKNNSNRMNDKLTVMQITDEDICTLMKTIRHHLDNQTRAERVFART